MCGPLIVSRSSRMSLICCPGLMAHPIAEVHVLRPERTFLGKGHVAPCCLPFWQDAATALAAPLRPSCLYRHEFGELAMKDFGLLASVVEHKKVFFREAAARYDLAKPGSLRVCPPESHVAQIRSDYRDMREMFFG